MLALPQASFLDSSLNGCLGGTYYVLGSLLHAGAQWGRKKDQIPVAVELICQWKINK